MPSPSIHVDAPDARGPLWELALAFFHLGLTTFGGPAGHLRAFQREFVGRRGWLDETAFIGLVGLCHALPGSVSSQLGAAIGLRRAGPIGAVIATVAFALPAVVGMIAFAHFAPMLTAAWGGSWLHGLNVAALAVAAHALFGMARRLAAGPVAAGIALGSGVGLVFAGGPVAQICVLAAGAAFGAALLTAPPCDGPDVGGRPLSPGAVAVFGFLLAALPFMAQVLASPALGLASVAYRAGALAFGDSAVVLALLETESVSRGWLAPETLLSAYGAAQALPGPSAGLAAFVGAASGFLDWRGGLVAAAAFLAPGLLLVLGVGPFWAHLSRSPRVMAAAAGVAAAAVGLLGAALWAPLMAAAVRQPRDWALVAAAFVFLSVARLPPWLVVPGFALAAGFFA
jgi:chromate transporter